MSCDPIQILNNPNTIDLNICPVNIQIIPQIQVINVCAQNPILNNFVPFFFTATENQNVFILPHISAASWIFINGTAQSQSKTPTPDYSVSGNTLTLSQGVDAGDIVFGMIQIM